MSASVKQNYVMIQGNYPDGTPGVEMVAGGFDYKKVGDEMVLFRTNDAAPWKIIKIFDQDEQAILREIESQYSGTIIENLFASNVMKKISRF